MFLTVSINQMNKSKKQIQLHFCGVAGKHQLFSITVGKYLFYFKNL